MIGVLDLQGGVAEHLGHLRRLGIRGRRVKNTGDIVGIAGLILPGGESTCLSRLLKTSGLDAAIKEEFQRGMKVWGTYAGAILLATRITGESSHLALVDMEIRRNGFGSQMDSFFCDAVIPRVSSRPVPLVFIRAPKIMVVGQEVDVLLKIDDTIAAVETDGALATVFHPELTDDLSFHRYFLRKCGVGKVDHIDIVQ